LRIHIAHAARAAELNMVLDGTYVCIEGPQFSTLAESLTYRQLGYAVIGMTNMPEAKLAREAEISYATIAMVTDYDCWHEVHGHVDVQSVLKVMHDNRERVQQLLLRVIRDFPAEHEPCPIGSDKALDFAIMTGPEKRDPALLKKLDAVAGRVLGRAPQ
jgi:5'-methylthioadenosine phosphorylase